jgi:two-component system sensor kinase FixL
MAGVGFMSDRDGDVIERTRLVEARFRLAAIVESSDDAIVGKDLNGVVTSWNRAAEAMFLYPAGDIVGRPITLIIPAHRIEEETVILDRIRRGERIAQFETERQRRDGCIIPVSLTISPIHDAEGRVVGVSKIARDLSEKQRVHRELAQREALLQAILDVAPDALVVIDSQGIIQTFSPAAVRLFGLSEQEAVGQNVSVLMPAGPGSQHDDFIKRYRTTGQRRIIGVGRAVAGQRRDGSVFPMELTVGEVTLPGTQLFAGFARDMTERQEREHRLSELQAQLVHVARVSELGQMVSALAHEVNQPLTAMSSYLSGIRRLLASGNLAAAQQAMEKVVQQGDRARLIIQRIRDHVRKREPERQIENLSSTIAEASDLALAGVDRGLALTIKVEDGAEAVVIDRIQIQQVLLNLIRNAVEAMAGSARRALSITAVRANEMVEISVRDSGPGLPAAVKERMFEPFFTTKAAGMGVGLSVCRTIVEAHGGTLCAEDGVDGGMVFRLTVPRPADAVLVSAGQAAV